MLQCFFRLRESRFLVSKVQGRLKASVINNVKDILSSIHFILMQENMDSESFFSLNVNISI